MEDTAAGVTWAAQIAHPGSWQIELIRRGTDNVTLSGGLADREFGHWMKSVASGESFTTPEALVTVAAGGLDKASQRLVALHHSHDPLPPSEPDLPAAYNDWCTNWGDPSHDKILAAARRLHGIGIRYFVIDDGWAERPPDVTMQSNGDWIVDQRKFPGGLKPTCDALRALGYIPGLWFEFEVVNPASRAWHQTRTSCIGIGTDHPDSLGEGLRQHLEGVQRFFRHLRTALPDLVIENCSSGGHRLEPSMMALASMSSFSDAHETASVPIIARNVQRVMPPSQSLIWAVLHPDDSDVRMHYTLAAAFLGRLCLSGDVHGLSDAQMTLVRRALALHAEIAPLLQPNARSSFHGTRDRSYTDPVGWQAVVRTADDRAVAVIHTFADELPPNLEIPLPPGEWKLTDHLSPETTALEIRDHSLHWAAPRPWHGIVASLTRLT